MYKVRWTSKQQAEFCKRWLRFRARYGISQQTIAEELGISVATVNRIERGKFVPRDETVEGFGELEKRWKAGEEVEGSLAWVPGEASEI